MLIGDPLLSLRLDGGEIDWCRMRFVLALIARDEIWSSRSDSSELISGILCTGICALGDVIIVISPDDEICKRIFLDRLLDGETNSGVELGAAVSSFAAEKLEYAENCDGSASIDLRRKLRRDGDPRETVGADANELGEEERSCGEYEVEVDGEDDSA